MYDTPRFHALFLGLQLLLGTGAKCKTSLFEWKTSLFGLGGLSAFTPPLAAHTGVISLQPEVFPPQVVPKATCWRQGQLSMGAVSLVFAFHARTPGRFGRCRHGGFPPP